MSTSVRSHPFRARPPARIAQGWRLAELLEQSEWTRTYRAHPAGNAAVMGFAVKLARADLATECDRDLARGLLLREAIVSRQVRQRNLTTTLEVVWHDDEISLVQPLLAGHDLSSDVETTIGIKLWIVRQAAQALAALHAAGWLHGNVSTEAIEMESAGHATLGELGWCRQFDTDECDLSQTSFMGQVRYAAPEMFDDAGMVTPAADIYSLGVVLVELLTGCPLLAEYDGAELIAAKRMLSEPEIDSVDLPYEVSSLAARMLSRDPLRRPTAGEVVNTLVAAEIAALPG